MSENDQLKLLKWDGRSTIQGRDPLLCLKTQHALRCIKRSRKLMKRCFKRFPYFLILNDSMLVFYYHHREFEGI